MNQIEKLNLLYGKAKPSARTALKHANKVFGFEFTDEETGEHLNTIDIDILFDDLENKKQNNMENIFAEGIICFTPKETAPDFILADVLINPTQLMDFCKDNKEHMNESEKYGSQLKLQLCRAKDGNTMYFRVDTFKPVSAATATVGKDKKPAFPNRKK